MGFNVFTMPQRKVTKKANRKGKRKLNRRGKKKTSGKIKVNRKFFNALQALRRMKPKEQRMRASNASKEFVKDVSKVMSQIRTKPHLVATKHRKVLKRYKKPLRQLVKRNTSLARKRKVLLLRGGILPFLVPIICASIAAAGSVGASAAGAAIMRS